MYGMNGAPGLAGHPFGPAFGLVGPLFSLLVIVGVIAVVVAVLRRNPALLHPTGGTSTGGAAAGGPATAPHEEALAIAGRRFASGEITKEEYEVIRTALSEA